MRRNFIALAFTVFLLSGMSVYGEDADEMENGAAASSEENMAVTDDDNAQQIYVEAKFVRIPEKDISEIASKLKISPNPRVIDSSFIPLILESENLEVLAGGAVLTENNQEATVRFVMKKYFPVSYAYAPLTEGNEDNDSTKDENNDGDDIGAKEDKPKAKNENSPYRYLMPTLVEPTDLGLCMTVTPSIKNDAIYLSLIPFLQSESEPTVYKIGTSEYKMPGLQLSTQETNGKIADGEMLIYSSNSSNDVPDKGAKVSEARELLLVTAKIMNPDGTPFKADSVKNADKKSSVKADLPSSEEKPQSVQAETMIVEVDSKDLAVITGKKELFGLPDKELIQKLLNSGKCRTLAAPQAISRSEEPALVREVHEKYFPSSWSEPDIKNMDGKLGIVAPYPDLGTVTDLGTELEFTAKILPDRMTIHLNFCHQLEVLSGWSQYECEIFEYAGTSEKSIQKYPMEMPIIDLLDEESNVTITSGETIPVAKMQMGYGHFGADKKGSRIIFVLLTATIMGPDGKMLKEQKGK